MVRDSADHSPNDDNRSMVSYLEYRIRETENTFCQPILGTGSTECPGVRIGVIRHGSEDTIGDSGSRCVTGIVGSSAFHIDCRC